MKSVVVLLGLGCGGAIEQSPAGTAFWHPGLINSSSGGVHTLVSHLPAGYDATVLINTVDPAYVNQVVDPAPFTILAGCCPTLDAAVDAFNAYWKDFTDDGELNPCDP